MKNTRRSLKRRSLKKPLANNSMEEELKQLLDRARAAGASREQLQGIVDAYKLKKKDAPQPTLSASPSPAGDSGSFDPESDGYDFATAEAAGITPDSTGHWPSRDPKTGRILKGRNHPTFDKTIAGEDAAGYEIYKGEDGMYYSQKKPEPSLYEQYQKAIQLTPEQEAEIEQDYNTTSVWEKFKAWASGALDYMGVDMPAPKTLEQMKQDRVNKY